MELICSQNEGRLIPDRCDPHRSDKPRSFQDQAVKPTDGRTDSQFPEELKPLFTAFPSAIWSKTKYSTFCSIMLQKCFPLLLKQLIFIMISDCLKAGPLKVGTARSEGLLRDLRPQIL